MPREVITLAKVDTSRPNKVGVQASDNRWFGVFDKALWPRLTEGATLNIEWQSAGEDGKYRNIVGILGTAPSANGTTPSQKETNIVREAALKAAVSYLAPGSFGDESVDQVLHVADRFVRWILNAEDDATPF